MAQDVTSRVAQARGLTGKLWKLSAPYWWCRDVSELGLFGFKFRVPERWIAQTLTLTIISMSLVMVYVSKLFNDWYGRFYNAFQDKNQEVFWIEIRYFTILAFIHIVIAVYKFWLQQLLTIRWRRWLTGVYLNGWLGDRSYYRMELGQHEADNPEQRIEQDVNLFTQGTVTIVLGLISEIVTLVTFTIILWGLSSNLIIPFLGGAVIPGFMVWVALLYAIAGSIATYFVGRRLVGVNFTLERYNADFRYRMTRVRENAESIALYNGETDEGRRLTGAFGSIYDTFWEYMRYSKRLIWLQSFYGQAAIIFPFLVAGPSYFANMIQLGVVMQIVNVFGIVQSSMSWFVETFRTLANWKATVDRLTTFTQAMQHAKTDVRPEDAFAISDGGKSQLALDDVQVGLPGGRVLLHDVDIAIKSGERVLIQGPSGSGKTTLFRVLAGLWPFGRGRLRLPAGANVMFLPQRPYLPIGSLRDVVCFPDKPGTHDDGEITEALGVCQLAHLSERLGETENWSMVLSPGEQQRLAFARAFLVRPDWLFLDEATSALDEPTETLLYELLRERLPQATMVSIAHKDSVRRFHESILRIDPHAGSVSREPLPAE